MSASGSERRGWLRSDGPEVEREFSVFLLSRSVFLCMRWRRGWIVVRRHYGHSVDRAGRALRHSADHYSITRFLSPSDSHGRNYLLVPGVDWGCVVRRSSRRLLLPQRSDRSCGDPMQRKRRSMQRPKWRRLSPFLFHSWLISSPYTFGCVVCWKEIRVNDGFGE